MIHFFLITNTSKDPELEFSNSVKEYILSRGGTAEIEDYHHVHPDRIPQETECIFVLGGDGTLIRIATQVQKRDIPLLGVNLGSLGYLCELERNTVFAAVDKLIQNEYFIEERMMLYSGEPYGLYAMNDAVIHGTGKQSFVHINVYVNGERLNTYHADGIIVATPTGSTGYNLSAGGPIVDPKAKMILLTPINDHNLSNKSIILSSEDEIEVELAERRLERDETASVSFDGDVVHTMKVGERIHIQVAPTYVKICRINRRSFLEQLRRKMEKYN